MTERRNECERCSAVRVSRTKRPSGEMVCRNCLGRERKAAGPVRVLAMGEIDRITPVRRTA